MLQDLSPSLFLDGLEHTLPTPNGLVGLGPTRWLLQDTRQVHLVALVRPQAQEVEVRDESIFAQTSPRTGASRFSTASTSAARMLELAAQQNVTPVLQYPLTPKQAAAARRARSLRR